MQQPCLNGKDNSYDNLTTVNESRKVVWTMSFIIKRVKVIIKRIKKDKNN